MGEPGTLRLGDSATQRPEWVCACGKMIPGSLECFFDRTPGAPRGLELVFGKPELDRNEPESGSRMGSRAQATIPSGSFRTLFVFPAQDGLQIDALLAMDGWLGSDAASFPTRFPSLFMVGFSNVFFS